jgi:hypothetical protein
MVLGLSLETFTLLHVVISLIALAAGIVVVAGMLGNRRLEGWTALFLATTVATSVTGFLFPATVVLPSHVFGAISLVVLAVAIAARYGFRLSGAWRWIYVVFAMVAFYLNAFVAVVQAFQKVSFLHPLAPTGSEPPFLVAQLLLLVVFIALGIFSALRFHPGVARASAQQPGVLRGPTA